MAARKQFLNMKPADPDLVRLLQAAKATDVTEDDLHEQRISFAYGNAPDSRFITKESVRCASHNIRLMA